MLVPVHYTVHGFLLQHPGLHLKIKPVKVKSLACWVKISADHILKYFSYISLKLRADISHNVSPKETICMRSQMLFSQKLRKNIIN